MSTNNLTFFIFLLARVGTKTLPKQHLSKPKSLSINDLAPRRGPLAALNPWGSRTYDFTF